MLAWCPSWLREDSASQQTIPCQNWRAYHRTSFAGRGMRPRTGTMFHSRNRSSKGSLFLWMLMKPYLLPKGLDEKVAKLHIHLRLEQIMQVSRLKAPSLLSFLFSQERVQQQACRGDNSFALRERRRDLTVLIRGRTVYHAVEVEGPVKMRRYQY